MNKPLWKDRLNEYFESVAVLEKSKTETAAKFDQFWEFIAEPAFENLKEEMKEHGIRVLWRREAGRKIHLQMSFPKSKSDNFHYEIFLPANSYELRLRLIISGRKSVNGPLMETKSPFLDGIAPVEVLKIGKEDLLKDVIERYKDFNLSAMTSPE
jgi:hypothetical protein